MEEYLKRGVFMDNLIKISASAASHVGMIKSANENSFYMNGRFMHEYEADSVQVSIEDSGQQFVFAVSDGMDREMSDKSSSISVTREMKKFHDKIKSSSKGIQIKLEQMSESVEETNNLFHSILLGNDGDTLKRPAFAGLLISENKAAGITLGSNRIYMLREGVIKQLTADNQKTERLLKMGIITDEQAQMLSNRFGISNEQCKSDLKKSDISNISEGDVFLLCSSGLSDMVDDERIYEILVENENEDPGYISHMLLKEALRNGGEDNITALVVKIEKAAKEEAVKAFPTRPVENSQLRQVTRHSKHSRKKNIAVRRIAVVAITLIIIAGVFYGLYKLWTGVVNKNEPDEALLPSSEQQSDPADKEDTGFPEETAEPSDETAGLEEEGAASEPDIAGSSTYKVKAGDTLYKISQRFYGDPEKYKLIMQANNIENPNLIQIGQVLVIPDASQAVP